MTKTKKTQCRNDLINRILTLDIEPGATLDEAALCAEYDLSRTPLREVFQQLAGEGYITLATNRGAKVSSMDLHRMRHFFQAAGMIYAAIARLAAENATGKQIDQLREIQCNFADSLSAEDGSATALLNHQFHAYIGEIAANPYLLPSYLRLLIDHTRIGQRFYVPLSEQEESRIATAAKQHDQLIDTIATHQPDVAVEVILEHWELTRNRIEYFVRPDPLSPDLGAASRLEDRHAV